MVSAALTTSQDLARSRSEIATRADTRVRADCAEFETRTGTRAEAPTRVDPVAVEQKRVGSILVLFPRSVQHQDVQCGASMSL